jgi:cutinase
VFPPPSEHDRNLSPDLLLEKRSRHDQNLSPDLSLEKRQASCKPYTLLWGRGTLEPGINNNTGFMLGNSIYQQLSKAQPGKWNSVGVNYNADFAGIYCVGMPGGYECMKQLTQLHTQCPQTKFVVGGFSQGAMVAHECVAFVPDDVRKQVAVCLSQSSKLILPKSSKLTNILP